MAKKKSKIAKLKAKARGDNAIAHVNLDEVIYSLRYLHIALL